MKNTLSKILLASALGFAGCATPIIERAGNTYHVIPGKTEVAESSPVQIDFLNIPQRGEYIATRIPEGKQAVYAGQVLNPNKTLNTLLIPQNAGRLSDGSLNESTEAYALVAVKKENGDLVLDNSTNNVQNISLMTSSQPLPSKTFNTGKYSSSQVVGGNRSLLEAVNIDGRNFTVYGLPTPQIQDLDVVLLQGGANYSTRIDLEDRTLETIGTSKGYAIIPVILQDKPKPIPAKPAVAPKPTLPSAQLR